MSHLKERKEKNCLNCNAQVDGRYCSVCGQENVEPKESVWHLVSHFFQDITHFDGKFFSTMKYLVLRPGFLSREYMIGRRVNYLNPIRMYVFTSAVFFLIFFNFFTEDENSVPVTTTINGKDVKKIEAMDSTSFADFTRNINREDGKKDVPMSREEFRAYAANAKKKSTVHFSGKQYASREQYDSIQATAAEKDGWFKRMFVYKEIEINKKYENNGNAILKAFVHALLHSLPQMIFVSLPLFALLLKLLYVRRKQFYYVNHGIFSIHFYIFIFISLLVDFGLTKLEENVINSDIISILQFLVFAGIFFYQYKALRNFYEQRRAKTILKFVVLNVMFLVVLTVLFMVFSFFSFYKI